MIHSKYLKTWRLRLILRNIFWLIILQYYGRKQETEQLTIMFCSMICGSSQTDSTKNSLNPILFTTISLIICRRSHVELVASNTWKHKMTKGIDMKRYWLQIFPWVTHMQIEEFTIMQKESHSSKIVHIFHVLRNLAYFNKI